MKQYVYPFIIYDLYETLITYLERESYMHQLNRLQ